MSAPENAAVTLPASSLFGGSGLLCDFSSLAHLRRVIDFLCAQLFPCKNGKEDFPAPET